ncbi:hypothetical protein BYT27DRAFT_7213382, partial [Phlegmacium glaucopus]
GVSGEKSTEATPNPSSVINVRPQVKVDEFMSSRSQPIADLHFSADGMSLAVIQRDGYVVKTFKICPTASVVLSSAVFGGSRMDRGDNNKTEKRKRWSGHLHQQALNSMQVYTLRRGRTSAVVEGADWSKDGRWLAIGTRKRTVHVFPVNPYGGKADIASHLEGRQQFLQDVLLFDPADGVLSLRRLSLDQHLVREQGLGMAAAAASVQALGVTSISLPGMGSGGNGNKQSLVADSLVVELVAKESTVATWHCREERIGLKLSSPLLALETGFLKPNLRPVPTLDMFYLAPSTFLINFLSIHYHALIRRHQFDICGDQIQVRKQVEISAYSSGGPSNNSAAFIEGFSVPQDIRGTSSSFDEPIASAISGSFEDIWSANGWDQQDESAIDEAEQFDDLSAVG